MESTRDRLCLLNSALSKLMCAFTLATTMTAKPANAQTPRHLAASAQAQASMIASTDRVFEVRYPNLLLVCKHLDGENPDVWSPDVCNSDIPVCDNSGHAGNVQLCLAYLAGDFPGSELQAAAFSVSRIENFSENECTQKWARTNTTNIHSQKVGALKFQAAEAEDSAHSHVASQYIYRIYHKACYELDVNIVIALPTAFAAEDIPRKLTPAEREQITSTLKQALGGFRFLK